MPFSSTEKIGIKCLALPRADLLCDSQALLIKPLNLHQSHVSCKVSWLRLASC